MIKLKKWVQSLPFFLILQRCIMFLIKRRLIHVYYDDGGRIISSCNKKIVDDLHTSEEEKFTIKKEMAKLESDIQLRVLEYEKQMIQAKSRASSIRKQTDNHGYSAVGDPLPC